MDRPDLDRCRTLLESAIALTKSAEGLERLAGVALSEGDLANALSPIAATNASIVWLVTNRARVDAVLEAGDEQWRVVFGSKDRTRIDWISVIARPPLFEGIERGRAVVLNGASGSGKSTIMEALQSESTLPWVIFDEPEQIGSVIPGYLIWRDQAPTLHRGYMQAIASLASAGNYVALAAAGHLQSEVKSSLADVPTIWVGLHCDRAILLQREQRSARWGGIADRSLNIHEGWHYDLTFDTSSGPDPTEYATQIIETINGSATR